MARRHRAKSCPTCAPVMARPAWKQGEARATQQTDDFRAGLYARLALVAAAGDAGIQVHVAGPGVPTIEHDVAAALVRVGYARRGPRSTLLLTVEGRAALDG